MVETRSNKKPAKDDRASSSSSGPSGSLSVEQLVELHQSRDVGAFNKLGGIQGLASGLGVNLAQGIAASEAENKFATRREKYGINQVPPPPPVTLFELIWEGLQDKTLVMLCIAAVVSLILGIREDPKTGWIEGTAILVAVVVVVMVASLNDYQKERQFRKLNDKKNNKLVKVLRGGEQRQVSVYEILVGDIVVIETGDILAADGILLEADNMKCDESAMTGESDMIKKTPEKAPFLLSGCQVTEGIGKMMVVCVGPNSETGRTMALLQTPPEDTPLQIKLEGLADKIARVGLIAATTILILLVLKFFGQMYMEGRSFELHMVSQLVKFFITAVTIVVVAVPEGLPLAVTISLAYSMMKMLKDMNLVRHLEACETMGGATNICSDKTGTLTKNVMTVVKGWIAGEKFEKVDDLKGKIKINPSVMNRLVHAISANSTAYEAKQEDGTMMFIGSKTETALLGFIRAIGFDFNDLRERITRVKLYPFSSTNKRMATIVSVDETFKPAQRVYVKGASEVVLGFCTSVVKSDGQIAPLNEADKKKLLNQIEEFASQGLRTICLAYAPLADKFVAGEEPPEQNLICVGIVGIKDPVRDEVPAAVEQCHKAGITVRMVTGDNILTAKKIAEECGIWRPNDNSIIAIEGPEFRAMSPAERDKIIPRIRVMARSSPTDKYTLVTRLKEMGEVVAVTGDGTNDAPALKAANVGFAMGITGTEVSKEASDIILMDDNFSSIVKAVLWGRNVYDSIRKFLQFQLTVNCVAVTVAFVGALTNEHGESPLKPVQLLWVNLIMDTMAALALATEPPTPDLLERKPYGKNDGLITPQMWRNIIGQGLYQLFVNFAVLYLGPAIFSVEKESVNHLTCIFNTFVLCQLFNEVNCRKLGRELNAFSGLFSNIIFVSIMIFTVLAQWLIVTFGGEFAGTTPLTSDQWLRCAILGAGSLPVGLLLRSVFAAPEPQRYSVTDTSSAPAESPKSKAKAGWNKVRATAKTVPAAQAFQEAGQRSLISSLRHDHRRTKSFLE
eukprot:TRINITY_DN604_c0_g2_i2.p1 TRINITY_DN604_c0_g2~~TRINITY_DN604_c0_g2_i2.p1  ORF type:complete len:1017 (-),score=417.27 TRINITY_DN604_c0_g2_i2:124-3174(-)